MKTELILALDQGSHASRAALFGPDGELLFTAFADITTRRPGPNQVELVPQPLLDSLEQVIAAAIGHAAKLGSKIAVAGMATQRSTTVAWDRRQGLPLGPILSWQDSRADEILRRLQPYAERIRAITGLRLNPYSAMLKMAWLVENIPAVRTAADRGDLVISPLAGFLTAQLLESSDALLDHANGSRSMLVDIAAGSWSEELLQLAGLSTDWLPQLRPVVDCYGVLKNTGATLRVVHGDQPAALFAWGKPQFGEAFINLGSGGFLQRATGSEIKHNPLLLNGVAVSSSNDITYTVEGTLHGCGVAFDWLKGRHLSGSTGTAAQAAELIYFVNSVGGLGSPWWRSEITPVFLPSDDGLTYQVAQAAVEESIVFMLHANLQEMEQHTTAVNAITITGGVAENDRICQLLADITGVSVNRPQEVEATMRGVAWLASGRKSPWPQPVIMSFHPGDQSAIIRRYREYICRLQELLET